MGKWASSLGGFVTGAGLLVSVFSDNVYLCVASLAVSRMGSNVRSSCAGAFNAAITTPQNRGKVFSTISMFAKLGKLLGPIIAGRLAMIDASVLPFVFSGCSLFLCSLLDAALKPGDDKPDKRLAQVMHVDDECGHPADYEELGRFIGDLLTERHYKWISHKKATFDLFDKLIPELRPESGTYLQQLEAITTYAEEFESTE